MKKRSKEYIMKSRRTLESLKYLIDFKNDQLKVKNLQMQKV